MKIQSVLTAAFAGVLIVTYNNCGRWHSALSETVVSSTATDGSGSSTSTQGTPLSGPTPASTAIPAAGGSLPAQCSFETLSFDHHAFTLSSKSASASCLDVTGNWAVGNAYQNWGCIDNKDTQTFTFLVDQSDCTLTIFSQFPGTTCLEGADSTARESRCADGLHSAKWTIGKNSDSTYSLISSMKNCLGLTASGAAVVGPCDSGADQKINLKDLTMASSFSLTDPDPVPTAVVDGIGNTNGTLHELNLGNFSKSQGWLEAGSGSTAVLVNKSQYASIDYRVNFAASGVYLFTPYYRTGLNGSEIQLSVNGLAQGKLSLPSTGGIRDDANPEAILFTVVKGENVLHIEDTGGIPFMVSSFEITAMGIDLPDFAKTQVIDPLSGAKIQIDAVANAYRNILQTENGVKFWNFPWSHGYIDYRISSLTGGKYNLVLSAAPANAQNIAGVEVSINGVGQGASVMNKTAGITVFADTAPVVIDVPKGSSILRLYNSGYVNGSFASGFNLSGVKISTVSN